MRRRDFLGTMLACGLPAFGISAPTPPRWCGLQWPPRWCHGLQWLEPSTGERRDVVRGKSDFANAQEFDAWVRDTMAIYGKECPEGWVPLFTWMSE